jgi:hypothetical protein
MITGTTAAGVGSRRTRRARRCGRIASRARLGFRSQRAEGTARRARCAIFLRGGSCQPPPGARARDVRFVEDDGVNNGTVFCAWRRRWGWPAGILLGLFFVTTGASVDPNLLVSEAPTAAALLVGLLAFKVRAATEALCSGL